MMMQLEDAANCLDRAQKYVVPSMGPGPETSVEVTIVPTNCRRTLVQSAY